MKVLPYLGLIVGLTACGCRLVSPKPVLPQPPAVEIRDNSYSLLYQLLSEERHVSKLLIIKRDSRELNRLVKDISRTAGKAADQLQQFSEQDRTLALNVIDLPPGEAATRDAIATTKKKELLSNSGDVFERSLLLTQIQALNYAAHLASVAADNDTNTTRSTWLRSLSQEMKGLYSQCVNLLARTPHGA
jgi:hypothetical protein